MGEMKKSTGLTQGTNLSPAEFLNDPSYLSVAHNSKDLPVVEKPLSTSFHLLKKLHDKGITRTNCCVDFADDDTVCQGSETLDYDMVRTTMMFVVPSKEDGIDDNDAPFEAIKKINLMLKTVITKIPGIRIGPWLVGNEINKDSLPKKLPEDIDIVERYVYKFDRFIFPVDRVYCRLNIYYDSATSIAKIESIVRKFKKPRLQSFQIFHSDAISPIQIGSLTGSVQNMATSPDFFLVFKSLFNLKHLEFW